jgi:VanZ family protein
MIRLIRLAAWLLLAVIVVATLGSPSLRPQSSLSHDGEHAFAFLLLGAAFGLGYLERRLELVFAAIPVIGMIELLQLWAPGRHARLEDFVVNVVAFWVALAASSLPRLVLRR